MKQPLRALRPFLFAALAIFTAFSAFADAPKKSNALDYSAIIGEFRASIPKLMKKESVPGLAVAVVDDQGTLWVEGFGYTDDDQKIRVTPETLFSIQSMSKNFTAAAVLLAVQDGLVDLDTPIKSYLPGFTVNSRFDAHPEEKITLRLLLSHKAGFTHEAPIGNNLDFNRASFEDHIKSISRTWLRFPVGQRYSYSNLGIDLAGYILQVRSDMPFQQYVKQKLLDPIGMTTSSFDMEFIKRHPQRAVGHDTDRAKLPVDVPMIPAGGLYTNANELARYVQFHLNTGKVNGQPLIKDTLLQEMYTIPFALSGQEEGYGLGIAIERKHGSYFLNHGGGGFGFLSYMMWYPEFRLGIVLLTNSATHRFQWSLPHHILDKFIEARVGKKQPEATKATDASSKLYDVAPSRLSTLAGQYLYNRGGPKTLAFKKNRLGIQDGKQFLPFTFVSDDEAVVKERGEIRLYHFVRSKEGSPSYAVSINDGEFLDYNVGPKDAPGPNKSEWDRYVGRYRYKIRGQAAGMFEIHEQNGYLLLDHMKLAELRPGLFFTSTGEALDLRGSIPTWRSIQLEKIEISPALKALLVVSQLLFLSAIIGWPVAYLLKRLRTRKLQEDRQPKKALMRGARPVAGILAALYLVFVFGLMTSFSFLINYGVVWTSRLPLIPKMAFVGLLLSAGLAAILPVFTILAWKRNSWTLLERLHYSLVTVAALFVTTVFSAWNLLKWPL